MENVPNVNSNDSSSLRGDGAPDATSFKRMWENFDTMPNSMMVEEKMTLDEIRERYGEIIYRQLMDLKVSKNLQQQSAGRIERKSQIKKVQYYQVLEDFPLPKWMAWPERQKKIHLQVPIVNMRKVALLAGRKVPHKLEKRLSRYSTAGNERARLRCLKKYGKKMNINALAVPIGLVNHGSQYSFLTSSAKVPILPYVLSHKTSFSSVRNAMMNGSLGTAINPNLSGV